MPESAMKPRLSIPFILRFVTALCVPGISHAAPWDFGAIVDVGAIYTDNLFLTADDIAESDVVFLIAPEFYATSDSDRIDADIRYRPEAYFYQNYNDADSVFHVVDATMTSTLVREKLFLYLSASNFQSIISPIGRFPTSNIPVISNRVDSRVLQARPYWQQRIGNADLLIEASYTDINYDDDLIQGNTIKEGNFEFNNIERQQGLAWGVNYEYILVEYESSLPWEYQRAALDLGYWLNGNFRLFVVGGAETDVTNVLDPGLDEGFWEAGFQYTPSQRLNLEAAFGDRFYGTSFRLNFDYTLRRGSTSLSYTEGPETRALVPNERPINDSDNLNNILDRPGRSDLFISRRLDWNTIINLAKSEFSLRVFGERREQRATSDGTPLEDEEFAGVAIRWSWNIGTNTAMGIGGDISTRKQTLQNDDLRRYYVDLTYFFNQRISLRGEVIHASQEGEEFDSFNYDENQFRLILRSEF